MGPPDRRPGLLDRAPSSGSTAPSLGARQLALLAVLALAARTFNLGTFSLWLDEVLLMLRATAGGPAAVWAACRSNAEHPPLSALAMAAAHAIGFSDEGQRLIPIVLGVGTVLLLAAWTSRHFGRGAGWSTGLVTALLPFHVRYSQELRPYAYLLFFAALALLLGDQVRRRPGPAAATLLAAVLVAGLYSHLLFALLAVPQGMMLAIAEGRSPELRRKRHRALAWAAAAWGAALAAFLPWFPALLVVTGRPPGGHVRPWTWKLAADRWQFLTVGGLEGDRLTWGGLLMMLATLLGLAAAWRRPAGRAALLGLAVGTLGVEAGLAAAGHWSNGRYDALGWLFLPVFIGVGAAAPGRRRAARPAALVLLAGLLIAEVAGLARYARIGRPHWDRVAAAVAAVRRPGEPVLVENEWTRLCLGYYLEDPDLQLRRSDDGAPAVVAGGIPALRRLWPADRAAVLVFGRSPRSRALRHWSWAFPTVERFPEIGGRVVLLTPEVRNRLTAAGRGDAGPASPGTPPAGVRLASVRRHRRPGLLASWWLFALERLGRGP